MDDRRIGFCVTEDGVRIAYATLGAGFPVLTIPAWASHVEIDSFPPDTGPFQLVHYDKRGTGLSDRHLGNYSIDTRLLDVQAVVDALGLDHFAAYGNSEGGPLAIAYAAAHPGRVSRLVLDGGFAVGDTTQDERETRAALVALVRANWGMGSAALTSVFWDDDTPQEALVYWHRLQREAVTPDDAAAMWEANGSVDVRHLLARIQCPTLVIHGRNDKAIPFDRGRELASGIRNATLFSDDGGHKGNGQARGAAVLKFLLQDEYFKSKETAVPESGATAIILFADIVDSTALTERMGDSAFRAKARDLDVSMRIIIAEAGGTTIDAKTLGDGVLATFPAASQAIDAALRCGEAGSAQGLPLHLGLHAGDVIREANNVFGGAVNIAARISALTAAGELLVSRTVADLARTSAGVTFEDRGKHALKGIAEPVRIYAIRKEGA